MNLVLKLNLEILLFTLLQWLGIILGGYYSTSFYSQSKHLPALLAIILTLGIVGFCEVYIHEKGSYLETAQVIPEDIQQYQLDKKSNTFKMIPAVLGYGVLLAPLLFMAYASYVNGRSDYSSPWFDFGIPILIAIGMILVIFGAKLGSFGWQKHISS